MLVGPVTLTDRAPQRLQVLLPSPGNPAGPRSPPTSQAELQRNATAPGKGAEDIFGKVRKRTQHPHLTPDPDPNPNLDPNPNPDPNPNVNPDPDPSLPSPHAGQPQWHAPPPRVPAAATSQGQKAAPACPLPGYFWQLLADPRMGFSPLAAFFFLFYLRKTHHQKQEKPPGAGTPPLHLPLHSFGVAREMSPLSPPPVPGDPAPVQPPAVLVGGSAATPTAAGSSGQVLLAGVTPAGCHHCHRYTQTVPNAPVSPQGTTSTCSADPSPGAASGPAVPSPGLGGAGTAG